MLQDVKICGSGPCLDQKAEEAPVGVIEDIFAMSEDGLKGFLKKLFGDTNEKRVKELQPYVDRANSFEAAMQKQNHRHF